MGKKNGNAFSANLENNPQLRIAGKETVAVRIYIQKRNQVLPVRFVADEADGIPTRLAPNIGKT